MNHLSELNGRALCEGLSKHRRACRPDLLLCDLATALIETDDPDYLPGTGPLILPGLPVEARIEVDLEPVSDLNRHELLGSGSWPPTLSAGRPGTSGPVLGGWSPLTLATPNSWSCCAATAPSPPTPECGCTATRRQFCRPATASAICPASPTAWTQPSLNRFEPCSQRSA